jgi:hypothetical protein
VPKELKVSVRTRQFAGGQSIDCTLSGLPTEQVWVYDENYKTKVLTYYAKSISSFVEGIRQDWNLDRSEVQVDYFDVWYYGMTEWDWRTM